MLIDASFKRNDEMFNMITLFGNYLSVIEVLDLLGVDHGIEYDWRNLEVGLSLQ